MDITIHDVTKEQQLMLDKLWSIDTPEELEEFLETLPRFRRQQASTLCIMMKDEYFEEDIMSMTAWPAADQLFAKIAKSQH